MPSVFAAAAADVSAAVDDVFGELFIFRGMLPVAGQRRTPAPDPSRADFTITGVWLPKPIIIGVSPKLTDAEDTAQKPGAQGQVTGVLVSRSVLLWEPRPGDRVIRVDTGLVTSVTRLADRGHGRIAVMLAR